MRRPRLVSALQLVLALVVAGFALWKLAGQWSVVERAIREAHPSWLLLVASCLVVLLVYGLLIQAWRSVLTGWGMHLGFGDAARIWVISNLGKYVPGKIWAVTTMAVMSQAHGVSPAIAAASSLLILVINTVVGFLIVIATGAGVVPVPPAATIAILVLGVGVLAAPSLLPRLTAIGGRIVRRDISLPRLPTRVVLTTSAACAVAWIGYGIAFRLFTAGLLGTAAGALRLYVAVFTGSYLIGFLAIFAPGGIGVRETVMAAALVRSGLATGPAYLVVAASRVWLTVLEILPALVLIIQQSTRIRTAHGDSASPRP